MKRYDMKLSDLLNYKKIYIQLPDDPDADSIASGYALYKYLTAHGCYTVVFYGGRDGINSDLLAHMVKKLGMPLIHADSLDERPQLLTAVNFVPHQAGVTHFSASRTAAIDHHKNPVDENGNPVEPPSLFFHGTYNQSCSSTMMSFFENSGENINDDTKAATALVFGLYDLFGGDFSGVRRIADKDLYELTEIDDFLFRDLASVRKSGGANAIAERAAALMERIKDCRSAVARAEECSRATLTMITEKIIAENDLLSCAAYCMKGIQTDISVKSNSDIIDAYLVADLIAANYGSASGRSSQASASISGFVNEIHAEEHIIKCIKAVYKAAENMQQEEEKISMEAETARAHAEGMKLYRKKNIIVGFVPSVEIAEPGSEIRIRMLEGDTVIKCAQDTYIMVGVDGEVYPIDKEKFNVRYDEVHLKPFVDCYKAAPEIIDLTAKKKTVLTGYLRGCRATKDASVYARRIDEVTLVPNKWCTLDNKVMLGKPGDFLCVNTADLTDRYICDGDIFDRTYEAAE